MVDVINPPPENIWIVELIGLVLTFSLGIVAIVCAWLERYAVTTVAMLLCGMFVIIILAFKGAFRK